MSSDRPGARPSIRAVGLRKTYRLGRIRATSIRELVNAGLAGLTGRMPAADPGVVHALDGISFEIQPGEVVGVVGPNGAGKTTLLKVLSRITTPSDGFVEIAGRVGSVLDIGLGFHPDLTGRENLRLGAAMLGMSPAETDERLPAILAFAGLDPFLDTSLKAFSTGMIMRLWFSLATHLDCDVLLVDEVLLVGDASFQRKGMDRLRELATSGRTVLITTHHLEIIQQVCTRVIQLERGRIVRSGPPREVVAAYLRDAGPGASPAMPAAPAFEGLMRIGRLAIGCRIAHEDDRQAIDLIFKQVLDQPAADGSRDPAGTDGSLDVARARPDEAWPDVPGDGLIARDSAGVLTITTEAVDAWLDLSVRPWRARIRTRPLHLTPDACRTHLSIVLHRLLLALGGVYLHAAAVVVDGRAHVFIGEKGAGKSTTALALGRAGATVLADDHVLVQRVGEAWQVSGCEALSRVTEKTERFLFDEPLPASPSGFGGTLKKEFELNQHFDADPHRAYPIAALYFPAVGGELSRTPLSPQHTVIDLLDRTRRSFRPQDADDIAALLDFWAGLTSATPAFRLALPIELDALDRLPELLAT